MRLFLKYLIPSIVCVVLWGCADKDVLDMTGNQADLFGLTELSHTYGIDSQESELCLPRPASFANIQRVQGGTSRTNSAQRNNVEFLKAGKVINAGVRYFVQINVLLIHSSHIKPSYRLLYLGKLII